MLSTELRAPEPFDFHLTASHQTYFRGKAGADLYVDGAYYRALRLGDRVIAAAVCEKNPGMLEIWLPGGGSEADMEPAGAAVGQPQSAEKGSESFGDFPEALDEEDDDLPF